MTIFKHHHILHALLLSGLLAATPLPAIAFGDKVDPNAGAAVPTKLPVPQTENGITFITGGIGDEERAAIEQSKANYNLYIMSAGTNGAFAGNSKLLVRNSSGDVVLEAVAGPLFYAKLPPGNYTIDATLGSQALSHKVAIESGQGRSLDLKWRPV